MITSLAFYFYFGTTGAYSVSWWAEVSLAPLTVLASDSVGWMVCEHSMVYRVRVEHVCIRKLVYCVPNLSTTPMPVFAALAPVWPCKAHMRLRSPVMKVWPTATSK